MGGFIFIGIVVAVFVALRSLWKYFFFVTLKTPPAGYRHDITLPHTDPIELYFADISPASMRVRMCLAAAKIRFKSNVLRLPTVGAWDTKTPEFLHINPAGTVPVLVHNGHPIYESNEQMKYIATKLVSAGGDQLLPTHLSDERSLNEYWVAQTNWCTSEIETNIETALSKRPGNCILMLVMPCFAAISRTLNWKSIMYGFLVSGCNPKQVMLFLFSVLGVHTFRLIPMLPNLVKKGKMAMLGHLMELEDLLRSNGNRFIGGNHAMLADIAWAPILHAMEFADWWECIDTKTYPCVNRYWESIKELPSFKEAARHVSVEKSVTSGATCKVQQWKVQYPWFKNMYE